MRIFTVKRDDTGEIEWEGFQGVQMACMLPVRPDIGLPTVFIDWDSLVKSIAEMDGYHLAWTEEFVHDD